jgi:hypothetical protein
MARAARLAGRSSRQPEAFGPDVLRIVTGRTKQIDTPSHFDAYFLNGALVESPLNCSAVLPVFGSTVYNRSAISSA